VTHFLLLLRLLEFAEIAEIGSFSG